MVIDWEAQNPEVSKGQTRCVINMLEYHEFHRSLDVMETGVKLVRMHLGQWLKYATDILVFPPEEAQERWDDTLKNAAEEEKDQKGPNKSPLRLPMNVADFTVAKNAVEIGKAMQLSSKRAKTTDDGLKEAKQLLEIGHVAFSDACFNAVGGATARRLAQQGGTFVGARGEGAFDSQSSTAKYEAIAHAAKDNSEKGAKKIKEYDVDIKSIKLMEFHTARQVGAERQPDQEAP